MSVQERVGQSPEQGVGAEASWPGPKNAEYLAARNRHVARGVASTTPLFVRRAKGVQVEDVDGRSYLDFAAGIGTLAVGHSHPRVVAAIVEQAQRFTHTCFSVAMYPPYVELARRLGELAPGDFPKRALFLNSGAEAVENAVKVARAATGRQAVIAFQNSFHGRTLLTMSLTGKVHPYREGFGPFAPEVYLTPYPYPYRFAGNEKACLADALARLERLLETQVAPETVAAVLVEPVQGEGGFVVPPRGFLPGLRELCDRHGIVLARRRHAAQRRGWPCRIDGCARAWVAWWNLQR
jgi:4-aminobutyrate aminotransferase/(S)-3-amino-2-methylpropionate transaminase